MNLKAVDGAVNAIQTVDYRGKKAGNIEFPPTVPEYAPDFVKKVLGKMIAKEGDSVTVSEMPSDGQFMTATTQYEKRNIATEIPVWNSENCVQCGMCSFICPHAAIRVKAYPESCLNDAQTFIFSETY